MMARDQLSKATKDYRDDLRSRSSDESDAAIARHSDRLMGITEGESVEQLALQKLKSIKKHTLSRDSSSFTDIQITLSLINDVMDTVISSEATANWLSAALMDTYSELLRRCDAYLSSHSSRRYTKAGQQRVETIQDLRELAVDEALMLQSALEGITDLGSGISLRQLLSGMRPLERVNVQASQFSFPRMETKPTAAESTAVEAEDHAATPSERLNRSRTALQADDSVDVNLKATLDILIEQIVRAQRDGNTNLAADLSQRVSDLCQSADSETLIALSEASLAFKTSLGVLTPDYINYYPNMMPSDDPYGGDDSVALSFPEYRHMDPAVARYLAKHTAANQGTVRRHLYGMDERGGENKLGLNHGYIQTSNSYDINRYLRALSSGKAESYQNDSIHQSFADLATIGMLDQASTSTPLPQKVRLHRMLSSKYLSDALGIETSAGPNIPADSASQVNKLAGTIITDSNFMCTGFVVDTQFASNPIMLTLLCDEGTPVYQTENLAEGEIILGRNTSYMILGAVAHLEGRNPLAVPLSHLDIYNQYEEGKETSGSFTGLEIFAKVLSRDRNAQGNRSQSVEAFREFQSKQQSYFWEFGTYDNSDHRAAYLKMAYADLASLDPQEAAAMDEYTNSSADINKRLRSGVNRRDVTDAQNTFIKRAFAKHPIPVAMDTFRGVSDVFLVYLLNHNPAFTKEQRDNALIDGKRVNHEWLFRGDNYKIFEGVTYEDQAFVSTSTNEYYARRWANGIRHDEKQEEESPDKLNPFDPVRIENIAGAHVMNMHLPAGTRAMFTDSMFTRRGGIPRGQDELTLDAGYRYTIDSVTLEGEGMLRFDVTLL